LWTRHRVPRGRIGDDARMHLDPAALRTTVTLAAALLAACCTIEPAAPPASTLYERVGGMPAITAVVDDTVRHIAADPRINRRFAGGQHAALAQGLVDLFCERTGGPCTYRGRDMSAAHDGMAIRDDEFDALVEDLVRALDAHHVPARERAELLAIIGRMRNAIVGH
jgi:hemoglobin